MKPPTGKDTGSNTDEAQAGLGCENNSRKCSLMLLICFGLTPDEVQSEINLSCFGHLNEVHRERTASLSPCHTTYC